MLRYTVPPPPPTADSARRSCRLLQLNCLAHWAVDNETAEGYAKRSALHREFIERCNPTICVLEEVDGAQTLPEGLPSLGMQLEGEYLSVHHAKRSNKGDETWVLLRKGQLDYLAHEVFAFQNDGQEAASQFALLCEVQWAGVPVEEEKEKKGAAGDQSRFLVVAMHAKAGRSEAMEAVRCAHTDQLLRHLRQSYNGYVNRGAVVWAGDMNAGPSTYSGRYPCKWYPTFWGGAESSNVEQSEVAKEYGGLQSAYRRSLGEEPTFTTIKHRDGALISQCIDYCFVGSGWEVPYVWPLPALEDVPPCALPCENWGSDHLPLVVDLQLK